MPRADTIVDSSVLPWVWSADGGIGTKVLNADAETGDRTVLLRSKPRPVTDATRRRAHYHDGVEEFLSLGPAFSFDGDVWHQRLSYLYLPPGTVHGTDVQVPDGYLLYLRTGGRPEPRFLATCGPPHFPGVPTAVADPLAARWTRDGAAAVLRLSANGSLMIRLDAGFAGSLPVAGARIELFVVDGGLTLGDDRCVAASGYLCRDCDAIGPVAAGEDTLIVVSPA